MPELAAGMLDVELDANMRAQRIVADEHPVLRDDAHGEACVGVGR